MSETKQPVDVLFVVPDNKLATWRHAIKFTLWAFEIEIDKTYDVISADTFVYLYGEMSGEEMDTALRLRCKNLSNTSDISKREWKAFEPLRQRLYDYWQAEQEATP